MIAIIQFVLSVIICGILYVRMIKREVPEKIGKGQAITPVALGVAALILSFVFFLGIGFAVMKAGVDTKNMAPVPGSILGAFLLAGLPEELAKLLMILLTLRIFRSKIRNVYEVILVGAGVGLGFTLFEEFVYGEGGANLFRLLGLQQLSLERGALQRDERAASALREAVYRLRGEFLARAARPHECGIAAARDAQVDITQHGSLASAAFGVRFFDAAQDDHAITSPLSMPRAAIDNPHVSWYDKRWIAMTSERSLNFCETLM